MPFPARSHPYRGVPLAACLLLAAAPVRAETWELDALEDFADLDSGDVPYYRDTAREALAVDAATVAYRDRFARATAPHPGPGGTFDVTLATLAEKDGETVYRLLVDGVVVATATNPRVGEEFVPETLVFDDVMIPAGAVLGVESAATSNSLVPENGEFAFARGRWTGLVLESDGPTVPDPDAIDLQASLSGPDEATRVGDRLSVEAGARNAGATVVATAPSVTLALPATLAFVSGEGCAAVEVAAGAGGDGTLVRCELAELAPGDAATVAVELDAVVVGASDIVATVSADQSDASPGDDVATLALEVLAAEAAAPGEVAPGDGSMEGEPEGTDTATPDAPRAGSSGGGAAGFVSLLALAALRVRRRGTIRPQV